jgi:hyperosmotically inducible periplasmic protein
VRLVHRVHFYYPKQQCSLAINRISGEQKKGDKKMIKHVFAVTALAAAMAFGAPAPDQPQIGQQVRHQLITLPYLGVFDNLTYRIDGNTVILAGQVTRPTLKNDAERVVKHIAGVQTVDNQIEVLPLSHHDDLLRRSLFRAIYGDSSLSRYRLPPIKPIRIIVKNGNVRLEGVVDNQADKTTAYIRANGVPGAFSVTNNLLVAD